MANRTKLQICAMKQPARDVPDGKKPAACEKRPGHHGPHRRRGVRALEREGFSVGAADDEVRCHGPERWSDEIASVWDDREWSEVWADEARREGVECGVEEVELQDGCERG